jgi:hypothetical protein
LQGTDFTSDDTWTGDAFVEVTSDQTVDASLTFHVYRVDAPFLVEFEDDNGQSLLICGGDSFTGSRPTSDSLGVGIYVGTASLTSSSGECTVDMAQMTLDGVDGTFDCPDFVDETQPDVTFAVTGTFTAANPFGDDVLP